MSSARTHRPMSMDEFLDWELRQPDRWEFDGFEPQAMVGATSRHHRIVAALSGALRDALRGRCLVYSETMKFRLAHAYRYPDVMIVCSPVPDDAVSVADPSVVIEVLSPGTARKDRIAKNEEYRLHPSIGHYVLIEQDVQAAEIYSREGGFWLRRTAANDDPLEFPGIGISIPLSAAYAGLDVPRYEPDPDPA